MSIELMKRQVEVQLAEYESEVAAAIAFMDAWRDRNDPAAKRVQRFRKAASDRAAGAAG